MAGRETSSGSFLTGLPGYGVNDEISEDEGRALDLPLGLTERVSFCAAIADWIELQDKLSCKCGLHFGYAVSRRDPTSIGQGLELF